MGERDIIGRQRGLISRAQALAAGMGSATVGRRTAEGEWIAMLPGVYRHYATPVTPEIRVAAAMLWLGPDAVLSGRWAAWWHGFRDEPDPPVTVTLPLRSGVRSRHEVRIRRRDLDDRDVHEVRGVQVISRALTALENARLDDGAAVFDRALQRRVPVTVLATVMTRFRGAAGATAARRALDEAADGTVSSPERLLASALRSAGLDTLKAGVDVWVGSTCYWLDFAAVAMRFAVEIDGYGPHSAPEQFEKDRHRQNALITAGWTLLRYTPARLRADMEAVVAEITTTLRTCGANFPPGGNKSQAMG